MSLLQILLLSILGAPASVFPVGGAAILVLAGHLFHVREQMGLPFFTFFEIGPLLATLLIYRRRIGKLVLSCFGMLADIFYNLQIYLLHRHQKNHASYRRIAGNANRKLSLSLLFTMLFMLLIALLLRPFARMLAGNLLASGCGLFLTALLLLIGCYMRPLRKIPAGLQPKDAFSIGILQGAAVFPSISPVAALMTGGYLSGFTRKLMITYVFLAMIPMRTGGLIVEGIAANGALLPETNVFPILCAILLSTLLSAFFIQLARRALSRDSMKFFSLLDAILGVVSIAFYLLAR